MVHAFESWRFLVNLGTLVAWFYLVPLAVGLDVPVYDANLGEYFKLSDFGNPDTVPYTPLVQMKVYSTLIRVDCYWSNSWGWIPWFSEDGTHFRQYFW